MNYIAKKEVLLIWEFMVIATDISDFSAQISQNNFPLKESPFFSEILFLHKFCTMMNKKIILFSLD